MSIFNPQWMERTPLQRYALGVAMAVAAAAGHWALQPLIGARVPFLLFLPAIMLTTAVAGRGPGFVVLLTGLVNMHFLIAVGGYGLGDGAADRIAALAYVVTGTALVVVGHAFRSRGRRELQDLQTLHSLSETLAGVPRLSEQLQLILATLVHLHGARHGLVTLIEAGPRRLSIAASVGFGTAALARLRDPRNAVAAAALSSLDGRVIIEDTAREAESTPHTALARAEGFRALHGIPLLGRDGTTLGAICLQFEKPRKPTEREIRLADICARKAALFIERAQAQERARSVDRRFKVVLEASGVPFVILVPMRDEGGTIIDFRCTFLNAAAVQALGHPAEDILDRPIADVLPATWNQPGLFHLYCNALERKETREYELHASTGGTDSWFFIVASPLEDGVAVWFADITERKLQEQSLREADRRKDEFIATLAHELRNPLAPIRQAALIASNEKATDAQKHWSYAVIERQVQHLALLLDDLLDVSRITRGTLQLRKRGTDLKAVIADAVETVRPLIDSRQQRFELELPEESIELEADPLRLAQVFSNLLNNAAKYTDAGGTVRLRAWRSGTDAVVRVEDDGIGISAEELPRIFEMFSQVRSVKERSEGGLGIGLALTKGLVELHGGSIEGRSEGLGRGAKFTVRLPLPATAAPRASVVMPVMSDQPIGRHRILIADDNRDAAESLALLLRMEGHEVCVANDGDEALRLATDASPDVGLLDIGMPRLNGYEVARAMRADPRHAGALLIAITGWGQDADRLRSVAAGFDHHLTKPVQLARLRELLAARPVQSLRGGKVEASSGRGTVGAGPS